MRLRSIFGRFAAATLMSVFLSACALPPIVTAVTVGADIFSLLGTGKTIADNGISLALDQDCALYRVIEGSVCSDYPPGEDTPEGAMIALVPLTDPALTPSSADSTTTPSSLAFLDNALALANGPSVGSDTQVLAFVSAPEGRLTGQGFASRDSLTYLTAGIDG